MKPIGTITRYYPLIGAESREFIASIMKQAKNYYEFVQQLVDTVCTTEISSEVIYLTTTLVWEIYDTDLAKKLRSVYGESLIVQAFMELNLYPLQPHVPYSIHIQLFPLMDPKEGELFHMI